MSGFVINGYMRSLKFVSSAGYGLLGGGGLREAIMFFKSPLFKHKFNAGEVTIEPVILALFNLHLLNRVGSSTPFP
jgi:hypothetical protein